jgi:hypothetical protein
MGEIVNMYTVVPVALANDLREKRRIKNYNTLKQLDTNILDAVREFMTDHVGFSYLPIACLSLNKRASAMDSTELFHYLPANNKENVLFQLQMPSDMIVTVAYEELLSASRAAKECVDSEDVEIVKEDLKELLVIGEGDPADADEEVISFIPFLDYTYCKFYAKFDDNFETSELDMPGIKKLSLARLSAFIE